MSRPWDDWNHIVKVDPDKSLTDRDSFEDIATSGTDAIEIGGTLDITDEKMNRVVDAIGDCDIPVYVEPSNLNAVVHREELDGYLVPVVLNAGSPAWITDVHKEWVRLDDDIDWARVHTEAYIILNPEASVAKYTQAKTNLDADEVAAYAEVAERMLGQEIVYVENSGTYGDAEKVQAAADVLEEATLFYGGGIHDYDSAYRMAERADTIVVGDLVHDEGVEALRETVRAANDAN